MEPYELDNKKIVTWCSEYASMEELEKTAKAIYALYIERRKKEDPESHKKNNMSYKKKLRLTSGATTRDKKGSRPRYP